MKVEMCMEALNAFLKTLDGDYHTYRAMRLQGNLTIYVRSKFCGDRAFSVGRIVKE